MTLLRLADIRKSFGGVSALRGATLDLEPGIVTALIGENGAGKSTLVKIIAGMLQPDAGRYEIDGAPVRFSDPIAAQRVGVCAMHQESVIFDTLSVAENIFVAQPVLKQGLLDWPAMHAKARELLARLHSRIDPESRAGALSVADRHCVQLARALAFDARVMVFDEPTASMSHSETEKFFEIVAALKAEGRAILFISHKFEEVFGVCDRYMVLRDGETVGAGALSEVNAAQLITMMAGRAALETPVVSSEHGDVVMSVSHFSRRDEFEDISFELQAGEILGVYGLVGAGRSELAQALFGLTRADRGAVVLGGSAYNPWSPSAAQRAGIAYVPEDRAQQGAALELSVRDNIVLPSLSQISPLGWIDRRAERDLAVRWGEKTDVRAASLDQLMQSLSGGNQQKAVLAKSLATAPRVLILDEPTKGVDVGAKAALHGIVRDLTRQGMAVLLISSDLPEVLALSHRILVMRRGRAAGVVARADANADRLLAMAIDG